MKWRRFFLLKRANKAVQWRLSNPRVHKKLTGVVANLTPFVTGSGFSTSDCTGGRRPCLESKFFIRASFWSRFSEDGAQEGFWGGREMWTLEVSSRRAEPTARSAAFASSFSISGRCCLSESRSSHASFSSANSCCIILPLGKQKWAIKNPIECQLVCY